MPLFLHLSEAGPAAALRRLRSLPDPATPGLRWAQRALTVPLGAGPTRPPVPFGTALILRFDDDARLDAYLERSPAEDGWSVRLEPVRAYGGYSALPDLVERPRTVDDDEPVVVLTLGRTQLRRLPWFLRASNPAERQALEHPAVTMSAGLARPPRFVGTFSSWRSAREMRAYATGGDGDTRHADAVQADRDHPFHHEAVFVRFRPYAERGSWRGHTAPEVTEARAAAA